MNRQDMLNCVTDNDYFKMGAAVAIGEMYNEGLLGDKATCAPAVMEYLRSFGITGFDDLCRLGMGCVYINDFQQLYSEIR